MVSPVRSAFKAFSKEGQKRLDRILSKEAPVASFEDEYYQVPVPESALGQNYSEEKFVHVGPKGLMEYNLDAEKMNAGLSPEGIYAGFRDPKKAELYAERLRERGIEPEEYELTTTGRNVFVLGQDKPNEKMVEAFEYVLKNKVPNAGADYYAEKIDTFRKSGHIGVDMARKNKSDIFRHGGADALLDGEDFVFLKPEQVREVGAKFDPAKLGESGLFKTLAPTAVALGLISSPEEAEAAYIPLAAFKEGTEAAKKVYDEVQELIRKGVDDSPGGELYQKTGAYRSPDGDYKIDVAELRARDLEMARAVGEFTDDAKFFINNPKRTRAEIRTPISKYLPANSPIFENFPELKDAKVVLRRGTAKERGTYGYYSPSKKEIHVLLSPKDIPGGGNIKNPVKAFNTLIHEFQHHIQDVKNAKNTGFNTKRTGDFMAKMRQDIKRLEKVVEDNPQDELAQAQLQQYKDLRDSGPREDLDYRIYVRELGEAEARSSGRKAFLTQDDPARKEVGVFYPASSYDPGTLEAVKIGSEVELPSEQILVRTYPDDVNRERELEFVDPKTKIKAGLGSVAGLAAMPSEAFAESLGLSTERTAMTDELPIANEEAALAYIENRAAANPTTIGNAPSDIVTEAPFIGEGLMAADILQMVGESQKMEEGEGQPEPVDEFSGITRDVNVVGNSDEDEYNTVTMRQGGGLETEAGQEMESKAFKLDRKKADLNKDGELSSYEKARGEAIQKSMVAEMNCGGVMSDPFAPMNVMIGVDGISGNDIPAGSMAHEVRDDIPAMLSEGEYVVPADVVRWHGLKTFEALRGEAKMAMGLMAEHGRMSFVDEDTKEPVEYEENDYEENEDDDIEKEDVEVEEAEVKVVQLQEGGGLAVQPTTPQTFYRYVSRLNPQTGRYEFVAVDPTTGQQVNPAEFDPARSTRYTPENVLGQVYQREPECPEGYRYDAETGACVPVEPTAPPVSVMTPTVGGGDGEGPPDVSTPQYSERLGTKIAERLGPLSAEDLADYEGATLAEKALGRMTDARPISLGRAALAALSGPMGILGLGAKSIYDEVGASRAALTRANEISGLAAGLDATALPRTYNFTFDPKTNSFKATSSTKITELQDRVGDGSWVTDYTHTDIEGNEIDPFSSDIDLEKFFEAVEAELAAITPVSGTGKPTSQTVPVTDLSRPVSEGDGGYSPAPGSVEQEPDRYSPTMDSESDNDNDDGFDGWGGGGYDNWSGDDESVGYGYNKGGYVARKNTPKTALLKR